MGPAVAGGLTAQARAKRNGQNGGNGGTIFVVASYDEINLGTSVGGGSGGRKYGRNRTNRHGSNGSSGSYFFFNGKTSLFQIILAMR